MPALPPVPNVVRFQQVITVGGLTTRGRYYMQFTGASPTAAQLQTHMNTVMTGIEPLLLPILNQNYTYSGILGVDLSSSAGVETSTSNPVAVGTETGNPCDAGTCALINFVISRRYRGGKPRVYLPLGSSGDLASPNAWKSTFLASVLALWNSIVSHHQSTPLGSASITNQVNVSYYFGFESVQNPITGRWKNLSKPRPAPLPPPDLITAVHVNPIPGSQRRRLGA